MKRWCNIPKKWDIYMILTKGSEKISRDAVKAFDKIPHPLMKTTKQQNKNIYGMYQLTPFRMANFY